MLYKTKLKSFFKNVVLFSLLFIFFVTIIFSFFPPLTTLNFLLKNTIGAQVSIDKVEVVNNGSKINIVLENVLFEHPQLEIYLPKGELSLYKNYFKYKKFLSAVNINSPNIHLVRGEDGRFPFQGDGSGSGFIFKKGDTLPLDSFKAENGIFVYQDNSLSIPESKEFFDIFITLTSTDNLGTEVEVKGTSLNTIGQETISLFANNYSYDYEVFLKVIDFVIEDRPLRLIYDDEGYVDFAGGDLNSDLYFNSEKEVVGYADIYDFSAYFPLMEEGITESLFFIKGEADVIDSFSSFDLGGNLGVITSKFFPKRNDGFLDIHIPTLDLDFLSSYTGFKGRGIFDRPLIIYNYKSRFILNDNEITHKTTFKPSDDFNKYLSFSDFLIESRTDLSPFSTKISALDFSIKNDNTLFPLEYHFFAQGTFKDNYLKLFHSIDKVQGNTNLDNIYGSAILDWENVFFKHSTYSDFFKVDFFYDIENANTNFTFKPDPLAELLINGAPITSEGLIDFDYNIITNTFSKKISTLDLDIANRHLDVDFSTEDSILTLSHLDLYYKDSSVITSGFFDFSDFTYGVTSEATDFQLETLFGNDFFQNGAISFESHLQGVGKKLTNTLKLYNGRLLLNNNITIDNFSSDIITVNDGSFYTDIDTFIPRISYRNYFLDDMSSRAHIDSKGLTLESLNNKNLFIDGKINFENANFFVNLAVKQNDELSHKAKYVQRLDGELTGNYMKGLNSYKAFIKADNMLLPLIGNNPLPVSGEILLEDNILKVPKLDFAKNRLTGEYDIKADQFSFQMEVREDDPTRYYSMNRRMNYRIIGSAFFWGSSNQVNAYIDSIVDRAFVNNHRLPNLAVKGSYRSSSLYDHQGVLELSSLSLLDENLQERFRADLKIDFKNGGIELTSKDKGLDLKHFDYLAPQLALDGWIDINLKGSGGRSNLTYSINAKGDDIELLNNYSIKVSTDISGDLEKISLDSLNVNLNDSSIDIIGWHEFASRDFDYSIKSDKLDISFFNDYLSKYGVRNAMGNISLNLHLKPDTKKGELLLNNFNVVYPEKNIEANDFNISLKLEDDLLYFSKFNGTVNNGFVDVKGKMNIPNIEEYQKSLTPLELLNYNLSISIDGFEYYLEDHFKVNLSSNLKFEDLFLEGEVIINNGLLSSLPEIEKMSSEESLEEIEETLRSELFKQPKHLQVISASHDLGGDFAMEDIDYKGLRAKVKLTTKGPILIDMPRFHPLLNKIYAEVLGNGFFTLKNRRLNFLGNIDAEKATVTLNRRLITSNRVSLIFDDPDAFFPDIDPLVLVRASSSIGGEDITIGVNGHVSDPKLSLSSQSGLSQRELIAVLALGLSVEDTNQNTALKSIVDTQVSAFLFDPISYQIEDFLNVSKFQVSSDIKTYETIDQQYEPADLEFGAKIEIENPIYKNFYWTATASASNNEIQDSVPEYDVTIEHRFKPGFSIGVGVGRLSDEQIEEFTENSKDTRNTNFHVDFKFKKVYNDFSEMFEWLKK